MISDGPRLGSFVRQLVKTVLGTVYKYTGISFIVRKTSRSFKIFAYHRISDNSFDPLGMNLSAEIFESHLHHIRTHCTPISLETALDLMQEGKGYPENATVLTFDDGYRDNYTTAFPLLKRYAIPATIFLSAQSVDNGRPLWFDQIVNSFRATDRTVVDLRELDLPLYRLSSYQHRSGAAMGLANRLKYTTPGERDEAIRYLVDITGTAWQENDDDSLMLTWPMVQEMGAGHISFGSHGLTHTILTTLSPQEARYELAGSRKLIYENTGAEPTCFAYPNGNEGDFNESMMALVKECGYRAACSLIAHGNSGDSLFALNRYCVTNRMLSSFLGGFSQSKLELELEKERIKYFLSFRPLRRLKHV